MNAPSRWTTLNVNFLALAQLAPPTVRERVKILHRMAAGLDGNDDQPFQFIEEAEELLATASALVSLQQRVEHLQGLVESTSTNMQVKG